MLLLDDQTAARADSRVAADVQTSWLREQITAEMYRDKCLVVFQTMTLGLSGGWKVNGTVSSIVGWSSVDSQVSE